LPKGYPKDGKPRKLSPLNRCAVCKHPDRPRIEALHCAGVSLDRLAERFELRRDAIWRHMGRHVTDERKAGIETFGKYFPHADIREVVTNMVERIQIRRRDIEAGGAGTA
jgi:hypothetical protein